MEVTINKDSYFNSSNMFSWNIFLIIKYVNIYESRYITMQYKNHFYIYNNQIRKIHMS